MRQANMMDKVWEGFLNLPESRQKELYLQFSKDMVYIMPKSELSNAFDSEMIEILCDAVAKASDFMLYVPTDTLILWNHTKQTIKSGNSIIDLIDDEEELLVQGIMDDPALLKEVLAYGKDGDEKCRPF